MRQLGRSYSPQRYSIASSASNWMAFGTWRPSALAVCRLMTNSSWQHGMISRGRLRRFFAGSSPAAAPSYRKRAITLSRKDWHSSANGAWNWCAGFKDSSLEAGVTRVADIQRGIMRCLRHPWTRPGVAIKRFMLSVAPERMRGE